MAALTYQILMCVSFLVFIVSPSHTTAGSTNTNTKTEEDTLEVLDNGFGNELFDENEASEGLDLPIHSEETPLALDQYSGASNTDFPNADEELSDPGTNAPPDCKCPKRRSHHHGNKSHKAKKHHKRPEFTKRDLDELNVLLNAEYLEAEFFLYTAYGYGLDKFNGTQLNITGPSPIGGQKGKMGKFVEHIAKEFGLQGLAHVREIQNKLGGKAIERPQIDVSRHVWHGLVNEAFGMKLRPSFDPYTSANHFLLSAYMLPYVSYTTYVGLNMHVEGQCAQELVARVAGVKAAQDAAIRTILYQRRRQIVEHYNMTVGAFTAQLSALRTKLDMANVTVTNPTGNFTLPPTVDEGVLVAGWDSAERLLTGNIISADENSMTVGRTPEQLLQVLYGTGNASIPGLFFPKGANGRFANKYLAPVSG